MYEQGEQQGMTKSLYYLVFAFLKSDEETRPTGKHYTKVRFFFFFKGLVHPNYNNNEGVLVAKGCQILEYESR